MLECTPSRSTDRIAMIVGDILAKHGVAGPVPVTADLARLGLTSIDMVELMLGVEAAFDVTIPPAAITLRNFGSVGAIDAMVTHLVAAS